MALKWLELEDKLSRGTGTVDGVALRKYVPGEVYDVSQTLADYLVLEGLALPEMRKSIHAKLKKKPDRRKPQ